MVMVAISVLQLLCDWNRVSRELWRVRLAEVDRTPQSAHHTHKNHDEHRQCNSGGGIHFAVLLGSDNSYTTPFEIPLLSEVFRGGGICLVVP